MWITINWPAEYIMCIVLGIFHCNVPNIDSIINIRFGDIDYDN